MSSVFPLLNSPHLVISEVFKMLELHELVALSLCSTKTNSLIKFNWKKPEKVNVLMIRSSRNSAAGYNYETNSELLLKVEDKKNKSGKKNRRNLKNLETVEIDGYTMPVNIHEVGYLLLYSNDEVLGLKKVTQYVCNLFNTHIDQIVIGNKGLWTIDWVNNNQKIQLPNAYIYPNETLSAEEYFKVLTECKVSDELAIHASPPQSFRFPLNLLPKVDCLILTHGHWVTIDHLINIDCRVVDIEQTKLTSFDLNLFLHHLLNGGCNQLEYLCIETENWLIRFDVLDGLDYIHLDEPREYKMRDGEKFTLDTSYVIKRSDGATLIIGGGRVHATVFVSHDNLTD